jgi:ABC-type cobalt transport system, ATPase component
MPEHNLSDISLEIQQGECVLLCGKSGSGKTTMTKLVNGLIPHFEEGKKTGTVLLDGNEVDTMPMYQISLKVASIFQDPKSQFFNIDTEDEIVFALENQGVRIDALEKRLDVTIKDLQLSTLVKKNLFEMSGGEKQIIAFACAYALNPDILVMDEPSSNLDLGAIKVIREILVKMKKQGKTILIAEHRFSYLNGLIDRAVWIEKGKISAHYTGEQFFALSEQERKAMGLRRLTPYREVYLKRFTGESSPAITPSLELKNVEVSFGKQSILQNISLSLQSGDVAAIIGTNGVGKTSLCRTICGFLDCKDGEIIINGATLKKKQRLKKPTLSCRTLIISFLRKVFWMNAF